MKYRFILFSVLILSFQIASLCPADQQVASIETQVLRVLTPKNSGYYHKPLKSPDFTNVKGSAFFFHDERKDIAPGGAGAEAMPRLGLRVDEETAVFF